MKRPAGRCSGACWAHAGLSPASSSANMPSMATALNRWNDLFITWPSLDERVLKTPRGTLTRSTCPINRVIEASGRVPSGTKTLELSVWTPLGRRTHGLLLKRAVSPSWIQPHPTAPAGPDRHDSRLRSRRSSASARRNCSSAAAARASASTRAWASDSARASACARARLIAV
jgi:hypothetical protein